MAEAVRKLTVHPSNIQTLKARPAPVVPAPRAVKALEVEWQNRISANAECQQLMLVLDMLDHIDAYSTLAE